jgi:hypothetical protein
VNAFALSLVRHQRDTAEVLGEDPDLEKARPTDLSPQVLNFADLKGLQTMKDCSQLRLPVLDTAIGTTAGVASAA